MTSTQEVLDHHLKCLAAGDLEGIVADYAPDVVLITPPGHFSSDGILRGTAGAEQGFRTSWANRAACTLPCRNSCACHELFRWEAKVTLSWLLSAS